MLHADPQQTCAGAHGVIVYDHQAMVEALLPYVQACPGPPLAGKGLALAAFQDISQGVEFATTASERQDLSIGYLRSVTEVANAIGRRREYLGRAAARRGYSFSSAIRWVTFLHAMMLRTGGLRWEQIAWRLRFNDAAGWSRFTQRLLARTPPELPQAPLSFWTREAIRAVFLQDRKCNGVDLIRGHLISCRVERISSYSPTGPTIWWQSTGWTPVSSNSSTRNHAHPR